MLTRRRCLALALVVAAPAFAQDTFENVERVVAFGDVHGDFPRFVALLRTAKLVDEKNAWIGGKTHLVLCGDFIDRGDESRKVMDLVMDLEPQAEKAGGQVHALIGNHEAMNIYGDLRYVSKADFESYRAPNSAELRDKALKSALEEQKKGSGSRVDEAAFRKAFEAEHPLGWVEQRVAFSPNGKYGAWLRKKNAIIRIDDAVFLHGGIAPKYAKAGIKEINQRIRDELNDFSKIAGGMAEDDDGPLWYRGLAQTPDNDQALNAHISGVLERLGARHMVIAHTPMLAIIPRFAGKVIAIDVGLSKPFGGPPAFLVMENSKYYAVHRGMQFELPLTGLGVIEYLRAAAALEPADSRLRKQVK